MRQERDIPEYVFEHLDTLKAEALKHGYTLRHYRNKADWHVRH